MHAAHREEPQDVIERIWTEVRLQAMVPGGARALLSLTGEEVERGTYLVVRSVGMHPEISLTELAAQHRTDVSTISRQVGRAEESGLIERAASKPGRPARLLVTARGEILLKRVQAMRSAIFARSLSGWSTEDKAAFAALLDRFAEDYRREVREFSTQETEEPTQRK